MDNKEFKKLFGQLAKVSGFSIACGGCYRESSECLFTLYLQKSSYSNYYYLLINICIQGYRGEKYLVNKDTVQGFLYTFAKEAPKEFNEVFRLDNCMEDSIRAQLLKSLFTDFLVPLSDKALTIDGIKELIKSGVLIMLPHHKEELNRMGIDI